MYAPDIVSLLNRPHSRMQEVLARFSADLAALERRHPVDFSMAYRRALAAFYQEWAGQLERIPFADLGLDGQVDYLLLRRRIERGQADLERVGQISAAIAELVPFAETVTGLLDARYAYEPVEARTAAAALGQIAAAAKQLQAQLRERLVNKEAPVSAKVPALPPLDRASAAAGRCRRLVELLGEWFREYDGYDPLVSWWTRAPYKQATEAMTAYADFLQKEIVGQKEGATAPISGVPLGRALLLKHLELEMIPYTPEELIAIGERELAWCERQMARAATELGFNGDRHRALEHVKNLHAAPGGQPALVRQLAEEAVEFLTANDLVTIPDLVKVIWRQQMITPEQQKVNPFFWGGEIIGTSFPHQDMAHDDKLMSMRGNNIHFGRATVHHELIPGHHLQMFMEQRYHAHRQPYGTPFYLEGWALYWEMLLWESGFPQSPEDRIGMLFWRGHRCARIVFSLKFHLGQMSPQECVEMLVERVGHERQNAEGEVRRSVGPDYPPLYQAAYMLGGLQLWALRGELVSSGKLSNRQFHDAVLEANQMPIELLRVLLTGRPLARDYLANWRFGDTPFRWSEPAGAAR